MTLSQKIVRFSIILVGIIGLSVQLLPNMWYKLSYYTNLSNIMVVAFFIYLVATQGQRLSQRLTRIKAGVTMSIALTLIVYTVLLAPTIAPEDFHTITNYTLHYIVPILTIVDWLIFDARGAYQLSDPFKWTAVPLLYMFAALIKGYIFQVPIPNEEHSPFPYFFIDIFDIGWGGFAKYAIIIFIAYILLGYLLLLIKRKKS